MEIAAFNRILTTGLCIVALLGGGCASKPVGIYRLQDLQIDNSTCKPAARTIPSYPKAAHDQGIEGYVLVEFMLNHKGLPKEARVVESRPPGVFDKTARSAVAASKYLPCLVAGEPVDTYGVREKIIFDLKQGPHYLGGDRLPFITP